MAYIQAVPYEQAQGRAREIYDEDLKSKGYIEVYDQIFSLRPEVKDAWMGLVKSIQGHMRLRRYELVTLAVAIRLDCRY